MRNRVKEMIILAIQELEFNQGVDLAAVEMVAVKQAVMGRGNLPELDLDDFCEDMGKTLALEDGVSFLRHLIALFLTYSHDGRYQSAAEAVIDVLASLFDKFRPLDLPKMDGV